VSHFQVSTLVDTRTLNEFLHVWSFRDKIFKLWTAKWASFQHYTQLGMGSYPTIDKDTPRRILAASHFQPLNDAAPSLAAKHSSRLSTFKQQLDHSCSINCSFAHNFKQ
jgi:hypothetical protein